MNTLNTFPFYFILQTMTARYGFSLDSPTIRYQFCTGGVNFEFEHTLLECGIATFVSNSTFKFGSIHQNVLNLSGTEADEAVRQKFNPSTNASYPLQGIDPAETPTFDPDDYLRLTCTATYPILWLADFPTGAFTLEKNDAGNRYSQNPLSNDTFVYIQQVLIQLRSLNAQNVLRCVSFSYSDLAAEVFLKLGKPLLRRSVIEVLKAYDVDGYAVEGEVKGTTMTVPCVTDFDDDDMFTLSKLTKANLTHLMGYSRENTSYDHRIGFRLEEKLDPQTIFHCQSRSLQEFIVPKSHRVQVYANVYYVNEPVGKARIHCDPDPESGSVYFQTYGMRECHSVSECPFKWAPLPPQIYKIPKHSKHLRQLYYDFYNLRVPPHSKAPEYNHGSVRCGGGITSADTGKRVIYFVEQDYWFTGLDNLGYIFSKSFPMRSIIQLHADTGKQLFSNSTHHFDCKISTFVLLPNIQFVVEYVSGPSKLLSLQQTLPLGAKIVKLSQDVKKATIEWQLEIALSIEMTKVICYAPWINSSQWAQADVPFKVEAERESSVLPVRALAGISTSVIFIVIFLILSLVILWKKYKHALTRNLTQEEVDEFHNGSNEAGPSESIPVENMPFNRKLVIASESLKIENLILGEGEYGIVHKGVYQNRPVAVKSSKNTADVEYFKAFLKEVKVMCYIGEHANIVLFLGAVVDKLEERKCHAVIEWSPFGNLNMFLRKHTTSTIAHQQNDNYENWAKQDITQPVLIKLCKQIAEGMEYLSQKKVIHGDLATRNILVFAENTVKITDFGLSRKLYSCTNYVKKKQARLPWRWMSLESLRFMEFSSQSDVWSFGVTVWEIFTMAQVPFSGIRYSTEFIDRVERGFRLSKPPQAPQSVYAWMMRCWDRTPNNRPTFSDCIEFLTDLDSSYVNCPLKVSEPDRSSGSLNYMYV